MVWIVTGAHGQLGTALCRLAPERMHGLTHAELDILKPDQIREVLDRLKPEGVINTAAYNFVDKAESDSLAAIQINGLGPAMLAGKCHERNLPLVHLSTDYIFSHCREKGGGFSETDSPDYLPLSPINIREILFRHSQDDDPLAHIRTNINRVFPALSLSDFSNVNSQLPKVDPNTPQGAYAGSKWFGEFGVTKSNARHFIIRTCGVYGQAQTEGKGNFVKTMLRIGREKGEVKVVTDQRCTPTSAVDLATGILKLIDTEAYGLYHLTNSGSCTWFEFAAEIFRQAGLNVKMTGITTEEYGAAAPRPKFSVLDCRKFIQTTGWEPPSWQDALGRYLAEGNL